ncbi:I267L [African swine fever virus]|uniref:I267L CDS protein n=1 Tax=African swine fever virus TaxID=10497 RepID=A0A6V6ZED8_ASF|nr:I267L [African swine fever virus]WEG42020.1 I267L [African swine fever virus]WEG42480.1 I267L [African swine fever virus]WEG42659.1 I267L [African swine fever virus]WFV29853.1 I267L [African swine fever virus]
MLLVLIDVDGFMGQLYNENGTQTILIPREVVIFYWEKNTPSKILQLFFHGGIDPIFEKINQRSFSFQSRHIHHFTLDESPLPNSIALPTDTLQAFKAGKKMIFQHLVKITKDHEQILLLHKGGPEGEWVRSFNIPNATVQNLNDLCCPSVEKLVLKKRDYISSSIGCPKHIQGSNHCPVFECHVLFKWIQENTSIVQGVLERPSLPYEKADLFIEHRINMVDNHPFKKDSIKQNQKKKNWIATQFVQHGIYVDNGILSKIYNKYSLF